MAEYIKPFLIGGSVIAGSKYVSSVSTPAIASLIGGLPTGIIASFFLSGAAKKKAFFHGYAFSSFVLFLSIVLIHLILDNTKLNPNVVSVIGLLLWACISYVTLNVLGLTKR